MKRIAVKLIVFLLLGAVVNVGVAWGCALWGKLGSELESDEVNAWMSRPPAGWPHRPSYAWIRRAPLVSETEVSAGHQHERTWYWFRHYRQYKFSAGLPFQSLKLTRAYEIVSRPEVNAVWPMPSPPEHWWEGIELPLELGAYRTQLFRYLPVQPTFPGFIINTVIYAAALWLILAAPFATRRLIRKRRGRCVRCGYDLRHAEHEVCPECGVTFASLAYE